MEDLTGRKYFADSWITESPSGLGQFELWDSLEYGIKDRIAHGSQVVNVTDNLKKIVGNQVIYYWYGDASNIILGVELNVRPQALVVTGLAKNPKYKGKSPWASELYSAILDDSHKALRIMSDTSLSDEGFSLWKRMFNQGHKISIYDAMQPGKTFKTFKDMDELEYYFQHDNDDFKRYQYVLTESGEILAETRSLFNRRRYRELIPGLL